MQFIKLRSMELKHTIVSPFCIQSYGNNFIIGNPIMEAVILNLNNEPDIAELFPFSTVTVDIPQDQLATKLLKNIDFRRIYDKCTVLEQQELGLDPIFVAEACIEPAKPRLMQAHLKQSTTFPSRMSAMLAIISTYGACHILTKNSNNRLWDQKVVDLTKQIISDVFPIKSLPSDFNTFKELRNFVNYYVTTTCDWYDGENIIYIANAAGFIIAFKLDEEENWKFLTKIQTNIGRISYLKSFDNYLIAVSIDGILKLFKLNENETLEALETLWNQKDRISCRQIVVEKCESDNGFTIFFAKCAYIICMQISNEGKLEGSTKLYVSGIKITGLDLFLKNELIVTTITAEILHITCTCIRENGQFQSINLNAMQVTMPSLDAENFQILGIGTTMNKALWLFMTYHNKELNVSMKAPVMPSHLILCRPNTLDPLTQLNDLKIDTMDPFHDIIMALRLDVWQANLIEKYNKQYSIYSIISQYDKLDETFLQKIQIHLEITRAVYRRSSYKLQIMNEIVLNEMKFLESGTQIVHILLRLEYLQSLIIDAQSKGNEKSHGLAYLTEFQCRAVYAMRKNFYISIEKLRESSHEVSKKDAINQLNEIIMKFIEFALRNWHEKCKIFDQIDPSSLGEKCLLCNELLKDHELMCSQGHNKRRCCVSFVQLPWLNNRYCIQCGTMALDSVNSTDMLKELFPTNESVKCVLCRFQFIN